MITDDDMSDVSDGLADVVPAKKSKAPEKKTGKPSRPAKKPIVEAEDEQQSDDGAAAEDSPGQQENDDQDEDQDEEEEYVVEKIVAHDFSEEASHHARPCIWPATKADALICRASSSTKSDGLATRKLPTIPGSPKTICIVAAACRYFDSG